MIVKNEIPQNKTVFAFAIDVLQTQDGLKVLDIIEGFNDAGSIGFSMLGKNLYKAYLNYFADKYEHIFYFTLSTGDVSTHFLAAHINNHAKFTVVENFTELPKKLHAAGKNLANCLIIVDHRMIDTVMAEKRRTLTSGCELTPYAIHEFLRKIGLGQIPVLSSCEFLTSLHLRQLTAKFCEETSYYPKSIFVNPETADIDSLKTPQTNQYIIKLSLVIPRVKPCKINSFADLQKVLIAFKEKNRANLELVDIDADGKKALIALYDQYQKLPSALVIQEFLETIPTIVNGIEYRSKVRLNCVAESENNQINIKVIDGFRQTTLEPISQNGNSAAITSYKRSYNELSADESNQFMRKLLPTFFSAAMLSSKHLAPTKENADKLLHRECNKTLKYSMELSSDEMRQLEQDLSGLFHARGFILQQPYHDWLVDILQHDASLVVNEGFVAGSFMHMTTLTDNYVNYLRDAHPKILLIYILIAIEESLFHFVYFQQHPAFLNKKAIHLLIDNQIIFSHEIYTDARINMLASAILAKLEIPVNFLLRNDLNELSAPLIQILKMICAQDNFKLYTQLSHRKTGTKDELLERIKQGEQQLTQAQNNKTLADHAMRMILSARYELHLQAVATNDPNAVVNAIHVGNCYNQ